MNGFITYLQRQNVRTWGELTHRDVCKLTKLWIAENQDNEFMDCVACSAESGTLASHIIDVYDAMGRCDREKALLSRMAAIRALETDIATRVKDAAERYLRVRNDWLDSCDEAERRANRFNHYEEA